MNMTKGQLHYTTTNLSEGREGLTQEQWRQMNMTQEQWRFTTNLSEGREGLTQKQWRLVDTERVCTTTSSP